MSLSKYLFAALTVAFLQLSHVGIAFSHEGEEENSKEMHNSISAQGKRVVEMLKNYATAIESGNISKIEKYVVMDDGFSSLEGTYQDLGWASYRKHLTSELPMFTNISYSLTNIKPYTKRKMAYATTDYALDVTVEKDGSEGGKRRLNITGKATFVLVKSHKEWRIRHIHTSRTKAKKPKSD